MLAAPHIRTARALHGNPLTISPWDD